MDACPGTVGRLNPGLSGAGVALVNRQDMLEGRMAEDDAGLFHFPIK
jgi:hypothetical protein